jgi:hypothetical protein
MISYVRNYFKDAQFVRMSDGTLCLIRDLGLVKGGKGLKHHETLVSFTVRGVPAGIRAFIAAWPAREPELRADAAKQL